MPAVTRLRSFSRSRLSRVSGTRGKTCRSSSRSFSLHTGLQQPHNRHDFPEVSGRARGYTPPRRRFPFSGPESRFQSRFQGCRVLLCAQRSRDFLGVQLLTGLNIVSVARGANGGIELSQMCCYFVYFLTEMMQLGWCGGFDSKTCWSCHNVTKKNNI